VYWKPEVPIQVFIFPERSCRDLWVLTNPGCSGGQPASFILVFCVSVVERSSRKDL